MPTNTPNTDKTPPPPLTTWAAIRGRHALLLNVADSDPRRWVLALTVDGKPVTIEGRRVSVDGWSLIDMSPDGAAIAAGDLVQHGEPVTFPAVNAQAELPLAPKVGDLHPWDALVDGCLYHDDGEQSPHNERLAIAWDGHCEWISGEDDDDIDGLFTDNGIYRERGLTAHRAKLARVIAAGLKTAEDFRTAIIAHRLGGAE